MIKEVLVLTLVVAVTYVNGQNPLMMMSLLKSSAAGGAGGAGGAGAGSGGLFMNLLNNPLRLCRETDNVRMIPCRGSDICNLMSFRTYKMPNLLKCSPLGMGCCFKDFASLQLSKMVN